MYIRRKITEKGITLIALVVTIIVLIILATVTINIVINGGIFSSAKESRESTIIATEKEAIKLVWGSLMINKITKGTEITNANFENELNNSGNNTNVRYEDDDESKNFLVNFRDTNHEYIVDKNGNITLKGINVIPEEPPVVLSSIRAWDVDANTDFHKESIKNTITEIEFVDYIPNPLNLNDNNCWDVSQEENQSVIAWLDGTKLYIGGNGGVKANVDSSSIFYDFTNVISINFSNKYDTKEANTMYNMFGNCGNLKTLDLSSFDTRSVTNMQSMFNMPNDNTSKLENIIFGNKWNTDKVTSMRFMFCDCVNLQTIYIPKEYDCDAVDDSYKMFDDCKKLVGGNGTKYSSGKVDKEYARIDKTGKKGYFTDIRQNLASNNTEIEYIESTGTQYIDTGYYPNNDTSVYIDYQYTEISTQSRLFGIDTSNSGNSNVSYSFYINGNKYFAYSFTDGSGNWTSTGVLADKNRHELYFNYNGVVEIDNETVYNESISGNISQVPTNTLPIMALNNGKSISRYSKVKIYAIRIYDKNTLVFNCKPVYNKITDSYGLYDEINHKFFANRGSGVFTVPDN